MFSLLQTKVPYNENLVENLVRVLELGYRNGKRGILYGLA